MHHGHHSCLSDQCVGGTRRISQVGKEVNGGIGQMTRLTATTISVHTFHSLGGKLINNSQKEHQHNRRSIRRHSTHLSSQSPTCNPAPLRSDEYPQQVFPRFPPPFKIRPCNLPHPTHSGLPSTTSCVALGLAHASRGVDKPNSPKVWVMKGMSKMVGGDVLGLMEIRTG